jgi:hypothetical protein
MYDHETDGSRKMVKVKILLTPSPNDPAWPPVPFETLWTENMGDNRYRVDNIPWFAHGLSYNDIISVEDVSADEPLVFDRLIEHCGHSTYRVMPTFSDEKGHEAFHQMIDALRQLGCAVERNTASFFAVDVPPTSNVGAVYEILTVGGQYEIWDFDVGYTPR